MYRHNLNATDEQIRLLQERCSVRPEDGQMLQMGKPCGRGVRAPAVFLRVGDKYVEHSLTKVAWLLAYGEYPEHNVSFINATRDCRPANLKRTTREPLC